MDSTEIAVPAPAPNAGGTQAIARAASLLREIANAAEGDRGLADLAQSLGLERPTAYRILRRLVQEGLVQQNPATKGYLLGPLIYELGLIAKPPVRLQALASEALSRIALESGDTAFAIVPSGLDSVCLDRKEGSYPVKALMMGVGRRRPMGIGAGSLAMLAAMPAAQAGRVLDANAARIRQMGDSDVELLKQAVEQGRRDDFVMRLPVDAPEILSLGVAVRNAYGSVVLALSVSALKFRIEHRLERLVGLLHSARDALELSLKADHAEINSRG